MKRYNLFQCFLALFFFALSFGSLVTAQTTVTLLYGASNSIVYGTNIQAQVIPPIASDNMRWQLGTAIIDYQITGQFNLTLPILSAGTYNYNALDTSQNINTVNALVITKATPVITLSAPGNTLHSGSGANIIASIVDLNSQIPVNVWINNVNIGSSYTTYSTNTVQGVGEYTVVANTLGNANYSATSVTEIFSIWKLTAGTGLQLTGTESTIFSLLSLTAGTGISITNTNTVNMLPLFAGNGITISSSNVISVNAAVPGNIFFTANQLNSLNTGASSAGCTQFVSNAPLSCNSITNTEYLNYNSVSLSLDLNNALTVIGIGGPADVGFLSLSFIIIGCAALLLEKKDWLWRGNRIKGAGVLTFFLCIMIAAILLT